MAFFPFSQPSLEGSSLSSGWNRSYVTPPAYSEVGLGGLRIYIQAPQFSQLWLWDCSLWHPKAPRLNTFLHPSIFMSTQSLRAPSVRLSRSVLCTMDTQQLLDSNPPHTALIFHRLTWFHTRWESSNTPCCTPKSYTHMHAPWNTL